MNCKLSFKFILNEDKTNADGKHPIYLRLIVDRKKAELSINKFINSKDWNFPLQRTKKDLLLNESLNALSEKVTISARNIEASGHKVDVKTLKDYMTGKEKVDYYLLEYFDLHIKFIAKNPELQRNTVLRYNDTLEHISDFLKQEKRTNDIQIKRVDIKFLREFEMFLLNHINPLTRTTLKRNTVNKHLVRLKTIILKANSEGIISANPFTSFKIRYTQSKREYLTLEEIQLLAEIDFRNNLTLDRVRDIFLWQVYTGLRFEDALSLTTKSIKKDSKGSYEINLKQEKTKNHVTIPLLQPAIKIYEKYDLPERKITGALLPKISNQKANFYLKHIATIAGINKELTTHVARHTCATTILLSNSVPIEVVSKWLGHTQIRTTQIYAKITNEHIKRIAEQVDTKI